MSWQSSNPDTPSTNRRGVQFPFLCMWAASVTCLQDSEGCCLTYEARSWKEGCYRCFYHLSVCLYLWISVSLSVCISGSLSVCFYLWLSVSVSLWLYLSVSLWLCFSLSLSILSASVPLNPLCLCPSHFGASHHAEGQLSPMEGPSGTVLISTSPEPDLTPAARQAGGHTF